MEAAETGAEAGEEGVGLRLLALELHERLGGTGRRTGVAGGPFCAGCTALTQRVRVLAAHLAAVLEEEGGGMKGARVRR